MFNCEKSPISAASVSTTETSDALKQDNGLIGGALDFSTRKHIRVHSTKSPMLDVAGSGTAGELENLRNTPRGATPVRYEARFHSTEWHESDVSSAALKKETDSLLH